MKIIRLSKSQVAQRHVSHPIFLHTLVKNQAEHNELCLKYLSTPTEDLKNEILFSNLHLVQRTVGRYLGNWPKSARFTEDMVSVGLETIVRRINNLNLSNYSYFRANLVLHLKSRIETFLNDNQSSVTASLSTNYRRVRKGLPMASIPDIPLTEGYVKQFNKSHFKNKGSYECLEESSS